MAQCQKCGLLLQRFPAISLGSSQLPLTLAPGAPVLMCLCTHPHTGTYSKTELGGVVHSTWHTRGWKDCLLSLSLSWGIYITRPCIKKNSNKKKINNKGEEIVMRESTIQRWRNSNEEKSTIQWRTVFTKEIVSLLVTVLCPTYQLEERLPKAVKGT